jgi:2-methylisocitrate lyase-like PEP mutase family enzyme
MTMPELRDRFLDLHVPGRPLLMPNAWDVGSATCLAALGFAAIGTSSAAIAAGAGAADGALAPRPAHQAVAAIAAATPVPVSADLENGYADSPAAVAALVRRCVGAGLAGISVEDWPRDRARPAYPVAEAARRVAAAVEAAAGRLVVTARADGMIRGGTDLAEIVTRLREYQAAGADVLFAPGITDPGQLRTLLAETTAPLSVMWMPGAPAIRDLADLGVARVSLGPFAMYAAYGALEQLPAVLDGAGAAEFWSRARAGANLLHRGRDA